MPIPKYFTHERAKALKEREKLLGQILAKLGSHDKDAVSCHNSYLRHFKFKTFLYSGLLLLSL